MAEVKIPKSDDNSSVIDKYKSLPSNSYKTKAEKELEASQNKEPKLTKQTTGKKQRKPVAQKFKETFLSPESDNVGSYILWDILIPAAKETFADLINGAINMILFDGEARSNRRGGGKKITNYSGGSKITIGGSSSSPARSSRGRRFADDILIEGDENRSARQVALDILEEMNEAVFEYGQVRLSDYYEAVGVDWSYTDKNWGWTSLEGVKPRAVRGGVVIDLPELEQL